MKNILKYSNEIDWDCNTNCNFKTKRSLKYSKINTNIKKNIIIDFSGFIKNKKNINKNKNTNKQNRKKNKKDSIKFNKTSLVTVYYGILFTLIFGFLFFLTISISYASSIENKSFDDEIIYNREITNKLLEDYLIFDNKNQESNNYKINNDNIIKKVDYYKYKVKENDTFEKITKGTGISIETIYLVNNIKKKTILKKGSILIIPNQNGRIITVNKNDSIFKLANLYGTKWEKIADANNLQSSVIYAGMKLFVPGSNMTEYERKQFYGTDFIWPVKGRITSYFGSRIDPITGVYSFHSGIDIKNKIGSKIKTVKDGKVIFIGWQKEYGNIVMVKHNDGFITLYGHLESITVNINQFVEQGEFIGTLGNTGRTTGPHLHFEVRRYGKLIDPLKYLS